MKKEVRCQAVILKEGRILVSRQYNSNKGEEYWLLPGGGLEEGENEQECVLREIREETGLDVEIKEVLFDETGLGNDVYKRYVTFLCVPKNGSVEKAGNETVSFRKILELVWCSLINESEWSEYLLKEQFYPSMLRIREKVKENIPV